MENTIFERPEKRDMLIVFTSKTEIDIDEAITVAGHIARFKGYKGLVDVEETPVDDINGIWSCSIKCQLCV